MNAFVCALRTTGEPLQRGEIFPAIARLASGRPDRLSWDGGGAFTAAARTQPYALRPLAARWRGLVGVGDVRLDNGREVRRWCAAPPPEGAPDLQLVLAAIDTRGPECIPELLGDFAFVVWDPRAQRLVAARDALGVKPLFYGDRADVLILSSRLRVFEDDERIDRDFVADFLVQGASDGERTIWAGARALPAGSLLVQRGTVRELRRYWTPDAFAPTAVADAAEQRERFRALFREAVARRVDGAGNPWAQLSGGLDSSSVVATAESLWREGAVGQRLAATVTVVDDIGQGDERAFSDLVARTFGLPNEQLSDWWAWRDDGAGAPRTDEPRPILPFFERDQRLVRLVRSAGGSVLLSGLGSDHMLHGTLGYITDLVGRGRLLAAGRELARWAVATHQSFWHLAAQHAVHPFLPRGLRLRAAAAHARVPAWIAGGFVAQYAVRERLPFWRLDGLTGRERFRRSIAWQVSQLQSWIERDPFGDEIELRYPFLYRPLVELSLRLPPELRTRPLQQKWVLREAMRGV
ncbi:MAG: hypothetical protein IRZ00_16115, partial [Gemmatimonadetes bacterium]|nr:hypothetical protein [Gemmatimonadota bacterium]